MSSISLPGTMGGLESAHDPKRSGLWWRWWERRGQGSRVVIDAHPLTKRMDPRQGATPANALSPDPEQERFLARLRCAGL